MGEMGQGIMGNLSQIVSFFSDFCPISYEFHTCFLHFPLGTFGTFSHFPISPHFPPFPPIFLQFPTFPPISPHFPPFFHFPHFPLPLFWLWLTPTPDFRLCCRHCWILCGPQNVRGVVQRAPHRQMAVPFIPQNTSLNPHPPSLVPHHHIAGRASPRGRGGITDCHAVG